MLIEIPDLDVILSGVVVFLIGVFGVFCYSKARSYADGRQKDTKSAQVERFEYYERQLIDMKIRLDTIDMTVLETQPKTSVETIEGVHKPIKDVKERRLLGKVTSARPQTKNITRDYERLDVTDHVLHLITDHPATSRDIQIAVGKTREHTSRLMKKLFDEGFVERRTDTKPYTYLVTSKGREKLDLVTTSLAV